MRYRVRAIVFVASVAAAAGCQTPAPQGRTRPNTPLPMAVAPTASAPAKVIPAAAVVPAGEAAVGVVPAAVQTTAGTAPAGPLNIADLEQL
ncbi:MAG: hypothetical protein ABGY75_19310, partial [Gemmataceae bacterium]